ncbi:FEM1B, partial [Symbiodinium pilosum]
VILAAEILGVDLIEEPFLVPTLKAALPTLGSAFQRDVLTEDCIEGTVEALEAARAAEKCEEAVSTTLAAAHKCEECEDVAAWHCPACEGSFCGSCFDRLHARGRRAEHPRLDLSYAGFKMKDSHAGARKQVINVRWHAFYDAQGLKYYYNFENQQSVRKLSSK